MEDRVIHPSMKLVKLGYYFAVMLMVAAVIVHVNYLMPRGQQPWLVGVAALAFIWPIRSHIRRQATKATISGDKLRYEAGLLSKTTRTIQLSKVQDVRVDQTLGQRILGVGDISIETSGESSRLTIYHIDRPQTVADEIIAASQEHGSAQTGAKR
jgi:uncharacterized membrane protein YdbT with pleckstrin-like domain